MSRSGNDGMALNPVMRMQLAVAMLVLIVSCSANGAELSPFASDGCSAFPNGTTDQKTLWLKCCIAHDIAYWKGGTYQDRLDADRSLEACVSEAGEQKIALLMLAGVRVGGTPFLPTRFRWGYGWPWPKFYGALDSDELEQVRKLSAEIETDIELVE